MPELHSWGRSFPSLAILQISLLFGAAELQGVIEDPKAPVTTTSPDENGNLATDPTTGEATITGTVTDWPFGKRPTYIQITITFPGVGTPYNVDLEVDQDGGFTGPITVPANGVGTIKFQPIHGGTKDPLGDWSGGSPVGIPTIKPVNVKQQTGPVGAGV